jgi:hypothetical protein
MILLICFLAGGFAGIVLWAFRSAVENHLDTKRDAEFLERQARFIWREFREPITRGTYLVFTQDMDMGNLMAGKADEYTRSFGSFREALIFAQARVEEDSDNQVSIVDDSAELLVCGGGRLRLRMPKGPLRPPGQ